MKMKMRSFHLIGIIFLLPTLLLNAVTSSVVHVGHTPSSSSSSSAAADLDQLLALQLDSKQLNSHSQSRSAHAHAFQLTTETETESEVEENSAAAAAILDALSTETEAEAEQQSQMEAEAEAEAELDAQADQLQESGLDSSAESESESESASALQQQVEAALSNAVDRVGFTQLKRAYTSAEDPLVEDKTAPVVTNKVTIPPVEDTPDVFHPSPVPGEDIPKLSNDCTKAFTEFSIKAADGKTVTAAAALTAFEKYLTAAEKEVATSPGVKRIRDLKTDRTGYTQAMHMYAKLLPVHASCGAAFGAQMEDFQQKSVKWYEVRVAELAARNELTPQERAGKGDSEVSADIVTPSAFLIELMEEESASASNSASAALLESQSQQSMLQSTSSARHSRFRHRLNRGLDSQSNSLLRAWAGAYDKTQCTNLCGKLKTDNTASGDLETQILAAIDGTNAWKGVLQPDEKALLKEVILDDIVRANDIIATKISEAVYTYKPALDLVNKLFDKFMDLIEWVDSKDSKPVDSTASNLFKPFTGATVKADNNMDNYGYVGDIGQQATNRAVRAVKAKNNMRVTLSLLYKAVYSNGRNGEGMWTLLARAAAHLDKPAEATKITQLGLNVALIKKKFDVNAGNVCQNPNAKYKHLSSANPGWSVLKYSCSELGKLSAWASKKTVPHQYSTNAVPPLSDEEIDLMFPPAVPLTGNPLTAYRNEIRRYGLPIPWKCGGDGMEFAPLDTSIATPLARWFPEWARSCGMSLVGGPSGSSDMLMQIADYFSFTVQEKLLLRAASMAWMVLAFDHSYLEVMSAAEAYDLPYHTYLTANKKWHEAFKFFMKRPASGTLTEVDADSTRFFQHVETKTGLKCYTDYYLSSKHIQRRAGQLWYSKSRTPIPATVPSASDISLCASAAPSHNLPTRFIQGDREGYLVLLGYNGYEDKTVRVTYVYVFVDGDIYVSDSSIPYKDYLAITDLSKLISYNSMVPDNKWKKITPTAVLGAASTSTHPCVKLEAGKFALCSHQQVVDRLKAAVKSHLEHGKLVAIDTHVTTIKSVFPESHGTALSQTASPINWVRIRSWLCALDSNTFVRTPIKNRVNYLKSLARCGGEDAKTYGTAIDACLQRAFATHSIQCTFSKPLLSFIGIGPDTITARGCTVDSAYIHELTARVTAALYSHQDVYGLFNSNDATYFVALSQEYFADALVDVRTIPMFPVYDGVMYSGVANMKSASINVGQLLSLGYTSFTRSIEVAWKFNYNRKEDIYSKVRKPKDFNQWSCVYVLVNPYLSSDKYFQPVGRQIYTSGIYGDSEQEITFPPAKYKVLGHRSMYATCSSAEIAARKRIQPCGAYTEVYLQLDSVRRPVAVPHEF